MLTEPTILLLEELQSEILVNTPSLLFPLISCSEVKAPGACHVFPRKYVGQVGEVLTHPGVLLTHKEQERNKCLDDDGTLTENSKVKVNGGCHKTFIPALNVLPPLPPIGSTLFSYDNTLKQNIPFTLAEKQYGYSIRGNSYLHVCLKSKDKYKEHKPKECGVNGLLADTQLPARFLYVNESTFVQGVVIHERTVTNSRGASTELITLVTCAPNIDEFPWAGKPSIVVVQTLFEQQKIFFVEVKKYEFNKLFVPVSDRLELPCSS